MADTDTQAAIYGEDALFVVEPHGIEHIGDQERHGSVRNLFQVWFSANLHLAVWTVGAIGITLGLNLTQAITSIVAGTVVGALWVGAASGMGPRMGMPQMIQSRSSLGMYGTMIVAVLAWLNSMAWFTIDNILGGESLSQMTGIPAIPALIILALISITLAVYGYNLIHGFEKVISWVVGIVFLGITVVLAVNHPTIPAMHPASAAAWLAEFTIMFSYTMSWGSYGSDYSRYLPKGTPISKSFWAAALGNIVSVCWLGSIGAVAAALFVHVAPVPLVGKLLGPVAIIAYLALTLGAIAGSVLNAYSSALSALTWNLPVKRSTVVLIIGGLSLILSLIIGTNGRFIAFIENYLSLLAYWMTPWLGILFVEFYRNRNSGHWYHDILDFYRPRGPFGGMRWKGLMSLAIGILVSVPFIACPIYTGPIGHALKGADISYFVSFVVSSVLYWWWSQADAVRIRAEWSQGSASA